MPPPTPDAFLSTAITLQPGQALRSSLDAGTWVEVQQGAVRLVLPPSWLSELVWRDAAVLREGEVHRLAHGGWIELVAQGPVRLRLHAPQTAPLRRQGAARWPLMRRVRLLLTGA